MAPNNYHWRNHFKLGPLCLNCGANMRFVMTLPNALRLILNIVSLAIFTNIVPVWYRCPECREERSTSD